MNKELELAQKFVTYTNRNIFVTGKAGTGKTTFLRGLKETLNKRMVIVAPTGVAAINARGVTIHSLFQLPFGPLVPNAQDNIKRRFRKEKINMLRSLDLVIIDEISMVRADVLDGIDQVLRRYKNRNKPFGGVQMLFIGDLQQLAPVVRPNDWNILKNHYQNAYFFSAHAYQKADIVPIELKHIYRQENNDFIQILNEIRNDKLSDTSAAILNKQYQPDFTPQDDEGYITLTTHNNRANDLNIEKLLALKTDSETYRANVEGDFAENNYPTAEHLTLKIGAQVMFIKNDSSFEKRYFNGKIGTVIGLDEEMVTVKCGEDDVIEVLAERWENIKYALDDKTQNITENIEGSFSQIPLRLAWAITIHKSQGLTFEKAIIDAEASFAHGQTYVALSRCKSLKGIVLKSKISARSIVNDTTVLSFNNEMEEKQPNDEELKESQKQFQLDLLEELFDFQPLRYPIKRLLNIYINNKNVIKGNGIESLRTIQNEGIEHIINVSNQLKKHLKGISIDIENPQEDDYIQERYQKAVAYFKEESKQKIIDIYETFTYGTDNEAIGKDIDRQLTNFDELLRIKSYLLRHTPADFSVEDFLKVRAKAVLDAQPQKKKKRILENTTEHTDLLNELKSYRKEIAKSEGVGAQHILLNKTLIELCELLPKDKKQLKKINGMGKVRIEKYGAELLEIINRYRDDNGLKSQVDLVEIVRESSKNTKEKSFDLFKEGHTIAEIAEKRGYAVSTIETHLGHFISSGALDITEVLSKDKIDKGLKIINNNDFDGLSELKRIAGNDFSFGELRILLGYKKQLESK